MRTLVLAICKQCGKEFKVCLNVTKKGGGKFCSHDCYSNSMKVPKTKRICEYCGKAFEEWDSRIKKGYGHFCSHSCAGKARHPRKRVIRCCIHCGQEFSITASVVKDNRGKFCSKQCSNEYHVGKNSPRWRSVEKTCPQCGKTFTASPRQLDLGNGKYCSKTCASDSQKTAVDRVCANCGKVFKTWPARVKDGGGKYCSKRCSDEGRVTRVQRVCKVCGKTFLKNPADIRRGGGLYCSPKCQSIGNSGENHFAWRGGVGFFPYCPKFNYQFKERVRENFNRTCYLCPTTEEANKEKLCVHHIDYNHNAICNGKEWAFVPVCRKCHAETNYNRWYWFNRLINYWLDKYNLSFDCI